MFANLRTIIWDWGGRFLLSCSGKRLLTSPSGQASCARLLMIILIRDPVIWLGRTETEAGFSPIFIDGRFQKMKIEKILHPSPHEGCNRLIMSGLWKFVIWKRCEHSLKGGVLVCWCTYQKPFQNPVGGWKAVSGILEVLTTFVKAVSTFSEVVTTFEKVVTAFAKIVTTLMTRYAF